MSNGQYRHAREAVARCGGVVGRGELADVWDLSRARIFQLTGMADFPEPFVYIGTQPGWLLFEVRDWRTDRLDRFG